MGLIFAAVCVNFRDAAERVNLIAGRDILPVGRILRGGKLEFVTGPDWIGHPSAIIKLRKGPDPEDGRFGADHWKFAHSNDHETYDATAP